MAQGKKFCAKMMILGECENKYSCESRHILQQSDRPQKHMPVDGEIKFEILTVCSPTHFTVRLLAHRSPTQSRWQKVPHVDDCTAFKMELEKYFRNNESQTHYPPQMGDLCVLKVDPELNKFGTHMRCEIIEINDRR